MQRSGRTVCARDGPSRFDETRAMPEIKRVLRPRGGVAILRTVPKLDHPWSAELGQMLMESRPEHPAFGERGAAAALEEDPDFGPVTETSVTTPAVLDRAQLLGRVASFSWVAVLPSAEREELLARMQAVLERHEVERVEHDVLHQIWLARLV